MTSNRGSGVQFTEEHFLPLRDLFIRLNLRDAEFGLSNDQVVVSRQVHGANISPQGPERPSVAFILWDIGVVVGLLTAYCSCSYHSPDFSSPGVILLLCLLAVRTRFYSAAFAYFLVQRKRQNGLYPVLRGGKRSTVPAEDLVPGDVIDLEAGNLVPADLRLVSSSNCKAVDLVTSQEMAKTENIELGNEFGSQENMLETGNCLIEGRCRGIVVRTRVPRPSFPLETGENVVQTALYLSEIWCLFALVTSGVVLILYEHASISSLSLVLLVLYESCIPHGFVGQLCMLANSTSESLEKQHIFVKENRVLFSLTDVNCLCVEAQDVLTDFDYEVTAAVVDGELRQFDNPSIEFFNGSSLSYLRILLSGLLTVDSSETDAFGIQNGLRKAFTQANGQGLMGLHRQYPVMQKTQFQTDAVNYATARTPDPNTGLLALSGPFPLISALCKSILISGHTTNLDENMKEHLEQLHRNVETQGVLTRGFAYAEMPLRVLEGSLSIDRAPLVYAGSLGLEPRILDGVAESIAECRLTSLHALLLTSMPLPQATSIALKSNILTGVSNAQATCITYPALEKQQTKVMLKETLLKPELVIAEADFSGKTAVLTRLRGLGIVPATLGFEAKRAGTMAFAYGNSEGARLETADAVIQDNSLRGVLVATRASQQLLDRARKIFILNFCSWMPEVLPFLLNLGGLPLPLSLPLFVLQKLVKETITLCAVVQSAPEPVKVKGKFMSPRTQWFSACLLPGLYTLLPLAAYFLVMSHYGFDPMRLPDLSIGTLPGPDDRYNKNSATKGNSNAGNAAFESVLNWNFATDQDLRLYFYEEQDWIRCADTQYCYTTEALKVAQTAYFLSLAVQSVFVIFSIRSLISSCIRTRLRPLSVQILILIQIVVIVAVVYSPQLNEFLGTRPLQLRMFLAATLPGMALTVGEMELYKWRLRSRS